MWVVTYKGFERTVCREFRTKERAERWARLTGLINYCTIKYRG